MMTVNSLNFYPGADFAGRHDAGKVHLMSNLTFDSVEEMRVFMVRNGLPTAELDGPSRSATDSFGTRISMAQTGCQIR